MSSAPATAPDAYHAARYFLECLDPTATSFTFLTRDDKLREDGKPRGDFSLLRQLHGTFNDLLPTLTDLNTRGAGVFVAVNRTDLKGRRRSNLVGCARALWHDQDAANVEPMLPQAAPPSLIIETSPGKKQRLWIVSEGLSLEDCSTCMRTLVAKHHSDPNAALLTQVLRLPGFWHHKRTPHLVRILGGSMEVAGFGGPYAPAELLEAFPPTSKLTPARGAQREPGADWDVERVRDALKHVPVAVPAKADDSESADYMYWLKIGMALHHGSNGADEGLELWHDWSEQQADKYDSDVLDDKWHGFRSTGDMNVTLGTLFHSAKENGWTPPKPDPLQHFSEAERAPGTSPASLQAPAVRRLAPVRADTIEQGLINWCRYPYFPAGAMSLIGSRGGTGKGLFCSAHVAPITTGSKWPLSDENAPKGRVLWAEAEDPAGQVLLPRWRAAGAELSMIDFVDLKTYAMDGLKDYVREHQPRMIVFSPFTTFLDGLADANSEIEARSKLQVIQDAIEGTHCAAIGICHVNKKADQAAIERLLGTVAFANFVRSVLLLKVEDDSTRQVRVVHSKFNWSPKGHDMLFTPRNIGPPRSQELRLDWEHPDADVDPEALYDRKKNGGKLTARQWLEQYLKANSLVPKKTVLADGDAAGHTESAIEKAHEQDPCFKSRMEGFPAKAIWWVEPR